MMRKQTTKRAFTVVELMISMTIMGLVLALAVVEFAMVFHHNTFMQANMTADQTARIAMAKVSNEVRQGMPDETDFTPPASPPPIVTNPLPGASPSQAITFYRVHNGTGGLTDPVAIPTDVFGNPAPCYDTVNVTYDPVAQTITRTITLVTNTHCPTASTETDVLARNVTSFNVTAPTKNSLNVDLQTTSTSGNYGVYDLTTQIALGNKP